MRSFREAPRERESTLPACCSEKGKRPNRHLRFHRDLMSRYIYEIRIDRRRVWRGRDPTKRYWEIKSKNPKKKVSIAVVATKGETLIVIVSPI